MQKNNITQLFNPPAQSSLICGTVKAVNGKEYVIQGKAGILTVTVAFSCMIRPEINDSVLIAIDEQQQHFILAVTDRPQSEQAVMALPKNTTISVDEGNLMITAQKDIQMVSANNLSMATENLKVIANKGHIHVEQLASSGKQADVTIERVKIFSDSIDTAARRISQSSKQCFRWVRDLDQLTAGNLIHNVKNLFSNRSQQAVITAKEDVKIDAERIHMG